MDCPATDRGIRMATGAAIYHSRPGSRLWRGLCSPASSDGHTRSADRTTVTVVERMCAERLVGSIRRGCLDHLVVFGERHLRHLIKSYQKYYYGARKHFSLQRRAPVWG